MSFLFASSHLPQTRVRRPEDEQEEEQRKRVIDGLRQKMQAFDAKQPLLRSSGVSASSNLPENQEEEEDDMQPMPRSGSVRAFSHLPVKQEAGYPAGPLSQRGAQALGRQLQRTGIEEAGARPDDGISAAKASGVFDVVRQQYNRDDSPHFMDEDGNLRPRDETRLLDSASPRAPQGVAGAPPRPAWNTVNPADADSSLSPQAPPPASDDTRPWYMPRITPEDLDPQQFDDDAAASHSAPKGRPEVHDLVYRTPGASTPKPGLQDLVYRPQGSATRNPAHAPEMHMVQTAAKNRAPVQSQKREDEPSHDRDFTAEQQKKFIEAMKNKTLELYYHHENRVGEQTPAAKTAKRDGKIVAYCNQYPSECVAAGYEAIGMPKTAQMIRDKTTKEGQAVQHLAKIIHERGWKSIFYNNDETSPGTNGEHAKDTGNVRKRGLYWGPDRMGADGKPKTGWMKVDGHKTDFSPGRPGYSDEVTEDLKKVDFGVVAGCRGNHGAVMSNGGTYDVHRSEPDVNHLYGKTDFNRTRGFLQSGLLLIPPGAHIPSHTPTK